MHVHLYIQHAWWSQNATSINVAINAKVYQNFGNMDKCRHVKHQWRNRMVGSLCSLLAKKKDETNGYMGFQLMEYTRTFTQSALETEAQRG